MSLIAIGQFGIIPGKFVFFKGVLKFMRPVKFTHFDQGFVVGWIEIVQIETPGVSNGNLVFPDHFL
jgi:hypothetical protein